MKNFFIVSTFFISIVFNKLSAQQLQKQWDFRYGTIYGDNFTSMQPTIDGGVLLGGRASGGISGDKTDTGWSGLDIWLIKINSAGIKQWDKDYGGCNGASLNMLITTTDKGFLLGALTSANSGCDKSEDSWGLVDFWLIKTDSLGNKQWDKDYGTTADDNITCLRQTKDGGYIVGGNTAAGISGDKTEPTQGGNDFWIIKLDSLGVKQWDKDFGTANYDNLQSIIQTSDGGYLFGGYTDAGVSGDKTQPSKGYNDYWIIKTDSLGVKQWDKDFGGSAQDYFVWMEPATDGGYILAGNSYSLISGDKTQDTWGSIYPYNNDVDFWLVKIDTNGNKVWDHDYGAYYQDLLTRIFVTADGGYLLSGRSVSDAGGDKSEYNFGDVDMWMLKINMLGIKQFDKTAMTGDCYSYSFIAPAVQTTDGCYVMAWNTEAQPYGDKTQPNWGYPGYDDYWAIKFCDTSHLAAFLSPTQEVCEKFCTGFIDQSTGNPTAWHWSFPGGTPDSSLEKNPTNICYNTPGTFDVTLITTTSAGNDTSIMLNYITVHPTPAIPVITQNGYTLGSSPAYSYQWQLNLTNIAGATNQSYDVMQSGYYTVIVGDTFGCVNSASQYILIESVNDVNESNSFSIFPNPSAGSFTLAMEKDFSGLACTIEVEDALGKIVFSSTEKNSSPNFLKLIQLPTGSTGIYFVMVKSAGETMRKKIIVE